MAKKLFLWAGLAAAGAALWHFGYPLALKYFFRASGTVFITTEMAAAMPGPNSMLFVVARNDGGVPVAVKKIINPVFPAKFEMTTANLIMPDLLTGRLYLEAMLNTHGQLGVSRKGDIKGALNSGVAIVSKNSEITLDTAVK